MLNACKYCGRLTPEEICSHCQQRVRRQDENLEPRDIKSDLAHWKKLADLYYDNYKKPVRVVRNSRGEMVLGSAASQIPNGCEVVYQIGGAEIENCQ